MINVGRVVMSRNFAQPKGATTIYRQSGEWVRGDWVRAEEQAIPFTGTVTVATPEDLEQVPEGDRVTGSMCFYSTQAIYKTRDDEDESGTSDEIEWHGERYRIYAVLPWRDFGYYKAFGARMDGA